RMIARYAIRRCHAKRCNKEADPQKVKQQGQECRREVELVLESDSAGTTAFTLPCFADGCADTKPRWSDGRVRPQKKRFRFLKAPRGKAFRTVWGTSYHHCLPRIGSRQVTWIK